MILTSSRVRGMTTRLQEGKNTSHTLKYPPTTRNNTRNTQAMIYDLLHTEILTIP